MWAAHTPHPLPIFMAQWGPLLSLIIIPVLSAGASKCHYRGYLKQCKQRLLWGFCAPLPSSQPLSMCVLYIYLFFLLPRFSCFYSPILFCFISAVGMRLDASAKHTEKHLCVSKSGKCLGPEAEGSKHQSPVPECVCSTHRTSPEGRFSLLQKQGLMKNKFKTPSPTALTFTTPEVRSKVFILKTWQSTFSPLAPSSCSPLLLFL